MRTCTSWLIALSPLWMSPLWAADAAAGAQ